MITPMPGAHKLKPGSASKPFLGILPALMDDQGNELDCPASGNLVIKQPWPGMMRTVYGDHQRFIDTYFKMYPGNYTTGDGARCDADGYWWITGRVDDVLNVSGHRLGTKEIESAALVVEEVAEAAVVPVAHDIKGKEPDLYIALKPGFSASDELAKRISDAICNEIGKIAKPRKVWIVPDMPKTRSGKIMRRVLGALSNKRDVGDTMTLANPDVVETIRKMVQE